MQQPSANQIGVSPIGAPASQGMTWPDGDGEGYSLGESIKRLVRSKTRLFILIGFNLAFVLIIGAVEPGFLDLTNMRVVINAMALAAPVAAAEALLLAAGRFDLAVGGIAALAGIVSGDLMVDWHVPSLLAFFLGLLFGALVGLVDGIFIEIFHVNSIIMTLAMWWITVGIADGITQGQAPGAFPALFQKIGQMTFLKFLASDYYALFLVLAMGIWFAFRPFGYHVLATGGDREAARLKGIPVERMGMILFTLSGLMAAFAGIVFASQIDSAQPEAYVNLALNAIAAAVIGGAGLNGGEGSIIGTMFGLFLLTVMSNAAIFVGLSALWEEAISGVVLVVAISFDAIAVVVRKRGAERKVLEERRREAVLEGRREEEGTVERPLPLGTKDFEGAR